MLFGEIYDNRRDAADGDIDIATTLLGTDGTIAALTDTRQDTRARAPGARGFTVALPLKDVAAGSYVLRVDARSRTDAEHTASRSIPLRVK